MSPLSPGFEPGPKAKSRAGFQVRSGLARSGSQNPILWERAQRVEKGGPGPGVGQAARTAVWSQRSLQKTEPAQMGPGCYLGIQSPSNQQNTLEIPSPDLKCSFLFGVSWLMSPWCTSPGQALCRGRDGSFVLPGVGKFREIEIKVWILPISVPPAAGQAGIIEIPSPAVVAGSPLA